MKFAEIDTKIAKAHAAYDDHLLDHTIEKTIHAQRGAVALLAPKLAKFRKSSATKTARIREWRLSMKTARCEPIRRPANSSPSIKCSPNFARSMPVWLCV